MKPLIRLTLRRSLNDHHGTLCRCLIVQAIALLCIGGFTTPASFHDWCLGVDYMCIRESANSVQSNGHLFVLSSLQLVNPYAWIHCFRYFALTMEEPLTAHLVQPFNRRKQAPGSEIMDL